MKRIVTIQYNPAQPGPTGPQGPPGQVGLPIDSSDVTYETDGRTVKEVLDELLFVDLLISAFSTPQIVFEVGQVITALTFIWAYNKTITEQTITGDSVIQPTLLSTDRAKTVLFDSLIVDGSVVLTAGDGSGNPDVTQTIDITFLKGVLYGAAPLGTVNSAFLNTLTKSLQAEGQKTVNVNLSAGQYGWFAVPVSYGEVTFKIGGINGGMNPALTVPYTNSYGNTENYYVYRTEFSNLGLIEIQSL